jgi:hypothetical protein
MFNSRLGLMKDYHFQQWENLMFSVTKYELNDNGHAASEDGSILQQVRKLY